MDKINIFHEPDSVYEPIVGNHLLSHPVSQDDGQIYCGGDQYFYLFTPRGFQIWG